MKKNMSLLFIVGILLTFINQAVALNREDANYSGGIDYARSRCVLCPTASVAAADSNEAADHDEATGVDSRIVWCNGPGCGMRIYNSLCTAVQYRRDGHCLHFSCLEKWLKTKNHCPVCRKNFFPSERVNLGGDVIGYDYDVAEADDEEGGSAEEG